MPKAKYEGIYHSIKKRIEAQDYPYQSLLPSENTLIEEYACSRNTVRRALAELVADGYVQTMQGRGVRVIYQPVGKTTFTIGGIETFQETARRNRLQAADDVLVNAGTREDFACRVRHYALRLWGAAEKHLL